MMPKLGNLCMGVKGSMTLMTPSLFFMLCTGSHVGLMACRFSGISRK